MLKRIRSKLNALVAIEVIITMTLYYFILVGATTISYAIDLVKTNDSNIDFIAYFINENGEKVESIDQNIDKENYLYVDIAVKNEGYLNGKIILENNNFNLNSEILSSSISNISSNEVILKQINAGDLVTIKLKIEPKRDEKIDETVLTSTTKVRLEGEYISSKTIESGKSIEIKGENELEVKWKSSDETKGKLEANILTNDIFKIDEEQKRVVQIIINSKLENNIYPVKNTEITLNTLENIEEVRVHARSTNATNSNLEFNKNNYEYDRENKKITIKLLNEDKENISWKKDAEDIIVVTYILNKDENVKNKKISVNNKIVTYDDKELIQNKEIIVENEVDGTYSSSIMSNESFIYKGKLYTGEEREYITKNIINIDFSDAINGLDIKENESKFLLNEEDIDANIFYKQTKINKEEFLKIFGEEGYITIKGTSGEILANINKNSEIDENGNILINYPLNPKSIELISSKPIQVGTITIENTKSIQNENYSREIIDSITGIKESENVNDIQNTTQLILKDTSSEATLDMDVKTISTLSDKQEITLEATLLADNESEDLYKNPNITITLPKELSILSAKYATLYKNGLEIDNGSINKNDNKENQIEFKFTGEQQKYDYAGGTKIYIKLEVKANKLTPSKQSLIKMIYTNENKNQTKETNVDFKLESKYGLMTYNQILNYNKQGDSLIAINEEQATAKLDVNTDKKEITLNTALINNYEETVQNVVLIGTIPYENKGNNFKAILNNIKTSNQNSKIYYSQNPNAIVNDDSWTESIENAVSYKIVLDEMAKEEMLQLNVSITIPENLDYNKQASLLALTSCEYNNQEKQNSTNIILETTKKIETKKEIKQTILQDSAQENEVSIQVEALAGDKSLNEEDTIFEGQTIRYKVIVTNNTETDYSNVNIKAKQKNGYVWDLVEHEVTNYYSEETSMEHVYELTDSNDINLGTIETLGSGQSYTFEYEAEAYMLNNNTIEGEETYVTNGTISMISESGDLNKNITTIKNTITKADFKLKVEELYTRELQWYSEASIKAGLTIDNLTDQEQDNVQVKVIFSNNLVFEEGIDSIPESLRFEDKSLTIDGSEEDSSEEQGQQVIEEDGEEEEEESYEDYMSKRVSFDSLIENEKGEKVLTMTFSSIKANESIGMWLMPITDKISEKEDTVKIMAQIEKPEGTIYSSNTMSRAIYNNSKNISIDQEIKLSNGDSLEPDTVINDGETIRLIGKVKNNDEKDLFVNITYDLNTALEIQNATVINGNEQETLYPSEQYTSPITELNLYNYKVEPQTELQIDITAKVKVSKAEDEIVTNLFEVTDLDNSQYYCSEKSFSINKPKDNDDDMTYEDEDPDYDDEDPEDDPGEGPGDDSGDDSEDDSGDDSGDDPGEDPGDDPGEDPGNDPGETPEENQGKDLGENPGQNDEEQYKVSGTVWIDKNKDGIKTFDEEKLEDIEVGVIDSKTGELKDTTTTDEDGEYVFDLPNGNYIVVFFYDSELYNVTTYHSSEANSDTNSDVINKTITLNDESILVGATDSLEVNSDLTNIDMGLIIKNTFDLKLDKYVSKITVNNNSGTKTYTQKDNKTLAKVDIHSKDLNDSLVIIEYKMKITNIGEVEGYVKNIVDYIPEGLSFNSSMNSDWYQSGNELYNKSLANTLISAGETKESESNTGLINNRAAIIESDNSLGIEDETNDESSANVIISVSTGALISYITLVMTTFVLVAVIVYWINRKRINEI